MDIGKDVLTRTLLGSTEAEKVFTPWWITLHHYLVYTIVILGLIALPINCMLSVNGNCSYKFDSPDNYALSLKICNVDEADGTFTVEKRHCSPQLQQELSSEFGAEFMWVDGEFEVYKVPTRKKLQFLLEHKENVDHQTNYHGCLTKSNPRLFGFFVYWHCVNQLSPLALYFPYLVLTLALVLVLLERLLTRYLWTGQRIEKFYELLVKEVLNSGDIDKIDNKENKQRCQQVLYDFRHSWFYCRAYILQTYVKLLICGSVLGWSLLDQCNLLRESFKTQFECDVFDYIHSCSIPSNGMNLIIFDLCNMVLFFIILDATFNLFWHYRFYGKRSDCIKTKLGKLIQRYEEFQESVEGGGDGGRGGGLALTYHESPDLQMLLNLLAEKEGIWSALLLLCLFDRKFRSEFRVRDTKVTSSANARSSRRKDVTLAWNEPRAASFIGENVPKEHLMYVLEIDPPVDGSGVTGGGGGGGGPCGDDSTVTMMPACSVDGKTCVFTPVERKISDDRPPPAAAAAAAAAAADCGIQPPLQASAEKDYETHLGKFKRSQVSRTLSGQSARSNSACSVLSNSSLSSATSRRTSASDSNNVVNIVEGVHSADEGAGSGEGKSRRSSSAALLRMKTAIALNAVGVGVGGVGARRRKTGEAEKVRNLRSTFVGLRTDVDYVISVSFVLSGRKLGSESFTILSHDSAGNPGVGSGSRKSSAASVVTAASAAAVGFSRMSPKTSVVGSGEVGLPSLVEGVQPAPNPIDDKTTAERRSSSDASPPPPPDDSLIIYARSAADLRSMISQPSSGGIAVLVLEFVASWCGLCAMIAPQMDLMAEEFCGGGGGGDVRFVRADVEDCPESAKEFGVEVLPSILVLSGGGDVVYSSIGQQLKGVREAILRTRAETKEEETKEQEEEKATLSRRKEEEYETKSMRMRKISSALEAVVTDSGIRPTER